MDRQIVEPVTIVAPASGGAPSAVAVVRISGPGTRAALEALCGDVPAPRHAALRDIGVPPIDRGLVLWFPRPHSFTGEDMAELQVHGSRAVIQAVVGPCWRAAARALPNLASSRAAPSRTASST
ncbi:MAG: hypothetical protein R3D30_03005 [Hyphomicrobiales bacterium]